MYRVRHLARAHGKSLAVLMRMSLALLSNHAISTHLPFFFFKEKYNKMNWLNTMLKHVLKSNQGES